MRNNAAMTCHRSGGNKKANAVRLFPEDLAERTGLEPATPGVTGRYSNQLNYRSKLSKRGISDE
jgi:hypothetical protein